MNALHTGEPRGRVLAAVEPLAEVLPLAVTLERHPSGPLRVVHHDPPVLFVIRLGGDLAVRMVTLELHAAIVSVGGH